MKISVETVKEVLKGLFCKTNRYVVAVGGALLWLLFFDSFTIIDLVRLNSTIGQLEKEIAYHENVSRTSMQKMNELKNNPETLEKYAREEFGMKKPNEDVFVVK